MNKAQLIEQIAKDAGITKKQANESLDSFTGAVVSTLKRGDTVTIVGFGTFSVTARAARNGRNPQTGATAFTGRFVLNPFHSFQAIL